MDELNERIAIEVFGWKWLAFFGRPVRGADGYPAETFVRQMFSPAQLENARWKAYLAERQVRDADGTEPLSYGYCSSGGSVDCIDDYVGLLRHAAGIRSKVAQSPGGAAILAKVDIKKGGGS